MTIRTTVAFDPVTVARWEKLTRRWGTSKSETLRRALEAADKDLASTTELDEPDFSRMTPEEIMNWLEAHPLLPEGTGGQWLAEILAEREAEAVRAAERETQKNPL